MIVKAIDIYFKVINEFLYWYNNMFSNSKDSVFKVYLSFQDAITLIVIVIYNWNNDNEYRVEFVKSLIIRWKI